MTVKTRKTHTSGRPAAALSMLMAFLTGCAATGGTNSDEGAAAATLVPAEAIMEAGDDLARRGEFERALTLFLRAVDAEESADAWFRVGAVCTQLGKSERALQAYLRVIELDPAHVGALEGAGLEYMSLGRDESARDQLQRTLELDERRWRAHNGLGILADQAGNHDAAIGHYERALEINGDSPMLLNNLGYSRYLAGDSDQAARDFFEATRLRADYTPAWSNLGMVYAQRGWYFDAVTILARVMDKATAYNDVGYIAFKNGDLVDAEHLLSEAVRLSPTYYQTAYRNLDAVRTTLGNQGLGTQASGRESGIAPATVAASLSLPQGRKEFRTVVPAGLNVRESGTAEAPIVGYLKAGDRVEVIRDAIGWSYVSFADRSNGGQASGWVRSAYLSRALAADAS